MIKRITAHIVVECSSPREEPQILNTDLNQLTRKIREALWKGGKIKAIKVVNLITISIPKHSQDSSATYIYV